MAGVYSHRFFIVMGAGTVATYVPPVGTRAVVRSVTATSFNAAGGSARVLITGTSIWQASFTGAGFSSNLEMRQVVYGGELLQGYTDPDSIVLAVSGYLFSDPARGAAAPGTLTYRELDVAGELPARLGA